MEDERAPRRLEDRPPAPPRARPATTVTEGVTSTHLDLSSRFSGSVPSRDATLFQELLRGFGEMRERMIAAESKVEFLSELLPEIWARMASQEATAQAGQRAMSETAQEARVQAAQASIAAERSHQTLEQLRQSFIADTEARNAAGESAGSAREDAQRVEVLAARLEEKIRGLAAAHADVATIRQEILEATTRSAGDTQSLLINTRNGVEDALRQVRAMAEAIASDGRHLHDETRQMASEALDRIERLAGGLEEQVAAVHARLAEDGQLRSEQMMRAAELESAAQELAHQAARSADAASEQAALMELREQSAAGARENTMKSVENIMRSARETFVASRDAGDEVIAQAREASAAAAESARQASEAVEASLMHAQQAAAARSSQDDATQAAIRAAASSEAAARAAEQILREQKDMSSSARQVARAADDARLASDEAAAVAARSEEAARAAAGEAKRVAIAEVDRVEAFERAAAELGEAAAEAVQAAETTRSLLWQLASDEVERTEAVGALSSRYEKELRSLEGAVQSARGAARAAQEASRAARQASDEATEDAAQAAHVAAEVARVALRVERRSENGDAPAQAEATFEAASENEEAEPGFWATGELDEEMLLEDDQDAMWVERFRRRWSDRSRRATGDGSRTP